MSLKYKYAFVSRHIPTPEQHYLAAAQDIELVHIGDHDAFTIGPNVIDEAGAFEGVVVVHPAAALRLAPLFIIGVFENGNRPGFGEKPQFVAVSLHLYDLTV